MFPTLSIADVVDERPGDPVLSSHGSLGADGVSYFYNLLWRQFVMSVFLTMHAAITSFSDFIFDVIVVGAREKMVRIDARRIIAPVEDVNSFWNWPDTPFVGDAVRSLVFSVGTEDSISILVPVSSPFDATAFGSNGPGGERMMNGSHVNAFLIRVVRARNGGDTPSEPELYTDGVPTA